MHTVLIADRDPLERSGLKWLFGRSPLVCQSVHEAGDVASLLSLLENEQPTIVCLEFDMLSSDDWSHVKKVLAHYEPIVLALSAEATYATAMRALDIQAIDLFIKPLSFEQFQRRFHQLQEVARQKQPVHARVIEKDDVFKKDALPVHALLLLSTDHGDVDRIVAFLRQYGEGALATVIAQQDHVVLLFPDKPVAPLDQLGQRFVFDWGQCHQSQLSVILYEDPPEGTSLDEMYVQAKAHYMQTFYQGFQQVISVRRTLKFRKIDPLLSAEAQREWVEMLDEGALAPIKAWLYETFLPSSDGDIHPELVRIQLTSVLAQVRRFMIQQRMDEARLERAYHEMFEHILHGKVLSRIVQAFILFISQLLEAQAEKPSMTDVIEQAVAFIDRSYTQSDLSLKDVAQYVGRNPSYLSALLSANRQSFRDLVVQRRIEKAKELLANEPCSIREVALRSGLKEANYLSRIFKKEVGLTPSAFRQQQRIKLKC
ncbi:helix-turn-helix domain-containing protein [Bacillus sp. FSL W7-1360]